MLGPLVGTVFFTALPELTRFLGSWRLFTFAILVLIVLVVQPRGLMDWIRWPQLPRRATRAPAHALEETPALRFEGVRKSFGHVDVLRDVTFAVAPGTIHALIGPNGAGKTTLLNIASGYVKNDGGSVRLGTLRLDGRSSSAIARAGLVRTFQNPRLFKTMTVAENLDAAVPRHGDAPGVDQLLRRLDLEREAHAAAVRSRTDSSGAPRSRARCAPAPRAWCSTNRRRAWRATKAGRCWNCSPTSSVAEFRCCWSITTCGSSWASPTG